MATLTIRIESLEESSASFLKDLKTGKPVAVSTHSFISYDLMHRILSPNRLQIIQEMVGQGPLGYREIARRVNRDFKGVHTDITALIKCGLIDRESDGVVFPYDKIRFDFKIEAKAA